ncbi:MAG: copper resistance protein CopC [Microthrixaceae bacterium]
MSIRLVTMRRVQQAVVALLVVVTSLVMSVGAAGAHAVLLASSPAADAELDLAPTEIVLEFTESVSASGDAVVVLDPSGQAVDPEQLRATNTSVVATLPELSADGSYTVTWKVISADGHPVRGAFLFHLRERTLDAPADAADPGTPLAASALRAAGATIALAAVVALFVALLGAAGDRSTRRPWLAASLGAALMVVGALVAVGESIGDSLELVWMTTSGRIAVLALVVGLFGVLASVVRAPEHLQLALVPAFALAVAVQGHAVSLPPVARSAALTVVHVAAALVWGTGLWWLATRARGPAQQLRRQAERGSLVGVFAVLVLAGSGIWLVLDRVAFDEMLSSGYGRLAILKSVLLVVAVALALRNRLVLVPSLPAPDAEDDDGQAEPAERLRRSVRAEVVVLALALVAGSVMAQVAPPDDAPGVPGGGAFVERVAFGDGTVELTVEPGRRGTNELHVTALGADGRLMDGMDDLSVALTLPSDDLGPLEPAMQRVTTGHSVAYAEFPLAGEWQVRVTGRPSRFEELTADFEVPIGE